MRIKALIPLLLDGETICPPRAVDVPEGQEHLAQRLIDNGSAEWVNPIQPSAESADGLSGDAAGAGTPAPAAEPISTTDAHTTIPEGNETAPTGGAGTNAGTKRPPRKKAKS